MTFMHFSFQSLFTQLFDSLNHKVKAVQDGGGTSGRGEVARKGGRRVNMCKNCVYIWVNAKILPVETIPGMGGG
jgi:hypothetical protein